MSCGLAAFGWENVLDELCPARFLLVLVLLFWKGRTELGVRCWLELTNGSVDSTCASEGLGLEFDMIVCTFGVVESYIFIRS